MPLTVRPTFGRGIPAIDHSRYGCNAARLRLEQRPASSFLEERGQFGAPIPLKKRHRLLKPKLSQIVVL
jgi:hypothetical protein